MGSKEFIETLFVEFVLIFVLNLIFSTINLMFGGQFMPNNVESTVIGWLSCALYHEIRK